MGRLGVAFRAFFAALGSAEKAGAIADVLSGESTAAKLPAPVPAAKPEPAPKKPSRSDALVLLDTLQRESRLLDLVYESLDSYTDEQIGGAARGVLNDTRKVLARMFEIAPLSTIDEGSPQDVVGGYDPAQFRLTGNVNGQPPFRGKIVHRGWKANRCELPTWTGKAESASILAPTEVEV
jgi:hypothetical protein